MRKVIILLAVLGGLYANPALEKVHMTKISWVIVNLKASFHGYSMGHRDLYLSIYGGEMPEQVVVYMMISTKYSPAEKEAIRKHVKVLIDREIKSLGYPWVDVIYKVRALETLF